MIVIGITGGSGTGKTTALQAINDLGGVIIDCDAVYHTLLETSEDLKQEIVSEFPSVQFEYGVNRSELARIVFSFPEKLQRLSEITHPHILKETRRLLKKAEEHGILIGAVDAAALVESGFSRICNLVVGVIAPQEDRIRRIMLRDGISREMAQLRISAQQPDSFYEKYCDQILVNDKKTKDEFQIFCRNFFSNILKGI